MVFDADELGLDPEDDDSLSGAYCQVCGLPVEDCECEEDDDAAASF